MSDPKFPVMPSPSSPRRLAAIMFTDMVGYSALTQRDETLALDLLSEHNQLIRGVLAAHLGREIKTVGDAFLVEFDSALDAVRCAIKIQSDIAGRNAAVNTEPISIRVGIHLGDVVYREGDVFGDGVNIAARVQSSAGADEILMSEDVARQVANKIEPKLIDLGIAELKNISQPVRLFAVEGFGTPKTNGAKSSAKEATPGNADSLDSVDSVDSRLSRLSLNNDSVDGGANSSSTGSSTNQRSGRAVATSTVRPNTAISARWSRRRHLLFGAALLGAVLVIAGVATWSLNFRKATIGSVAILPFENGTGDASIDYLSDGISESLINKLSGLSGLRVISRSSAFSFKGKKMDSMEIGRTLGVDAVVIGTLAQRGTSLTITSELVRVSNAAQLWGEKYNRRADDMLQVESEIATTIAQTLRRQLSVEEKAKLVRNATSDPEAYRLYLRGRSHAIGSQQEMDKGIDLMQQAVALAPEYALAHAGLAHAYARQAYLRASSRTEVLGRARAAADRALALDPTLAEAHVALAGILYSFDWDWAGAEAAFKKALGLNAGSSDAHQDYGSFLIAMGRLDEGLSHSQEASRLDPLAMSPLHDIGINYWVRGDYEKATAAFRRAIDIDPNWTWGYVKLARLLATQKQCKEAFSQADNAERKIVGGRAPLARSWLGAVYAICGDTKRAREKLAELHALEKTAYVDPVTFATVHASLGEVDEAIRWYEKAFNDRTPNMVQAALIPKFDTELRNAPRIQAIIDRMGFPK
jgi:class 3 adenylate cyclase/TolB-like protein/Tfp pilus assembly protein PilF